MKCDYCNAELDPAWFELSCNGKRFCDSNCLDRFYFVKINELEKSLINWKNAWFELREIIGRLGCDNLIRKNYKGTP